MPKIASELHKLGIFSEWARDIATNPSTLYSKTFDHVFHHHLVMFFLWLYLISLSWEPVSDFDGKNSSLLNSRYLSDFEELQPLGHGGFGHVVLCKNKLDGRQYAVKMILLKDKSPPVNDRILREVATLARLQHQHVVRYYQAWIETGVSGHLGDSTWGSETGVTSSFTYKGGSSSDIGQENKLESPYLYIQMEYCPRLMYGAEDPSIAGMVLDSPFSDLVDLMMELVVPIKSEFPNLPISSQESCSENDSTADTNSGAVKSSGLDPGDGTKATLTVVKNSSGNIMDGLFRRRDWNIFKSTK